MKIVYFSNFINHHQANVSDELYKKNGIEYTFVELIPIYDWLLKGGYSDLSSRPYVLQAWKSEENYNKAIDLLNNAEVALFGSRESLKYKAMRAKTGKLSFNVGERWLKRGWINVFSPNFISFFWTYWRSLHNRNFYSLCASAFSKDDFEKLHIFRGKNYKWGYFTKVDESYKVEAPKLDASTSEITPLMWCARFLKWKHPELPIQLAARLKADGYKIVIDMFGSGVEFDATKMLAKDMGVEDVVRFRGNLPNDDILSEMQKHPIFLFTSDRNEGWGAVVNEAMSNGCCVIGSDAIGSVPYLIQDKINGLIFKSCDLESLYQNTKYLLDNPEVRYKLAVKGVKSMQEVWSPKNAANTLLKLIDDLLNHRECTIEMGPCSLA